MAGGGLLTGHFLRRGNTNISAMPAKETPGWRAALLPGEASQASTSLDDDLDGRSLASLQSELQHLLSPPELMLYSPDGTAFPDSAGMAVVLANPVQQRRFLALLAAMAKLDPLLALEKVALPYCLPPSYYESVSQAFKPVLPGLIARRDPKILNNRTLLGFYARLEPEAALQMGLRMDFPEALYLAEQSIDLLAVKTPGSLMEGLLAIDDDLVRAACLKRAFGVWNQNHPDEFSDWLGRRSDREALTAYAPAGQMNQFFQVENVDQGVARMNTVPFNQTTEHSRHGILQNMQKSIKTSEELLRVTARITDAGWRDVLLVEAALDQVSKNGGIAYAAQLLPQIQDPSGRSKVASSMAAVLAVTDVAEATRFAEALPTVRERKLALASIHSTESLNRSPVPSSARQGGK